MRPRAGVYGMAFDRVGGGQRHQAILADLLTAAWDVDLIHHVPGLTHSQLAEDYGLDLQRVNLRFVDRLPDVWPYAAVGDQADRDPFEAHHALTHAYDLFVNVVVQPPIRSYARRGVLVVLFPFAGQEESWPWNEPRGRTPIVKRIIRNAWYARRWRSVFAGYQQCVANSGFTAGWIKTRWGLDAEVVYPPVRAQFDEKPKCNTILSVGRFARNGTRKRQTEMVRAFTRASDTLLQGWEFVCLGGVADNPADQRCFQEASDAARGYPVQVQANVSDRAVRDAYERAAVFWHAAGYGEDERQHPERFEHFGMSTVEAMAAGCVPVVIRKGGQPEIVQHGSSGFLWDTTDELVGYTHRLATAPALRDEMARAARLRARAFTDPDEFAARMLRILEAKP